MKIGDIVFIDDRIVKDINNKIIFYTSDDVYLDFLNVSLILAFIGADDCVVIENYKSFVVPIDYIITEIEYLKKQRLKKINNIYEI